MKTILSLMTLGCFLALPVTTHAQFIVDAETILIDIQNVDGTTATTLVGGGSATWNATTGTTGWNNAANGSLNNLSYSDGSASTVGVTWSNFLTIGSTSLGAGSESSPAWNVSAMFNDGFYIDDSVTASLAFTGLDAGQAYRFIMHAQRSGTGRDIASPQIAGASTVTSYDVYDYGNTTPAAVGQTGAYSVSDASSDNSYLVMEFVADGSGNATWSGAGSNFPYIEGVVLQAVPEPGTAVLAALSASFLLLRRRRRS